MSLIPRGFGNSLSDPLFGSSIFDPFDSFDRAFTNFPGLPREVSSMASTRVDWVETPEAHVFKADLPGMKKEEIKVQVLDEGILSISGERGKEEVNERDSYRRVERSYGKFSRQFKLPSNAKPEEIYAKVDNGVLTVTVPKHEMTKDTAKLRDVEIS